MDELQRIWPDWEVVEVLGHGSYGSVLKARRQIAGYEDIYSAIKIVTIPLNAGEVHALRSTGMDQATIRTYYKDLVDKLIAEISIMQSLKAIPEIVRIEDFQIIADDKEMSWRIYIRMELLDNLGDYQKRHPMTTQDVVRMGIDICRALVGCQEKDVIHRDIKPANILVDENGMFKLADFGIARQVSQTIGASTQAGSENYMAPEVMRGEKYDYRVDLYSLGLTMYEMLNYGRMPFLAPYPEPLKANDIVQARYTRLQGTPLPSPANADDALSRIILKACAHEPAMRYESAAAMLRDLERYQKGEEVVVTPPPQPKPTFEKLMPVIIGVLSVVAVVMMGIIIVNVLRGNLKPSDNTIQDAAAAGADIEEIQVSSTATREGYAYATSYVIDDDVTTAWACSGNGSGQTITFLFKEKTRVFELEFVNGYGATMEGYLQHARVKQCTVTFDDAEYDLNLQDAYHRHQVFELPEEQITRKVTITISDVYTGTAYDDTAIAEITFK